MRRIAVATAAATIKNAPNVICAVVAETATSLNFSANNFNVPTNPKFATLFAIVEIKSFALVARCCNLSFKFKVNLMFNNSVILLKFFNAFTIDTIPVNIIGRLNTKLEKL